LVQHQVLVNQLFLVSLNHLILVSEAHHISAHKTQVGANMVVIIDLTGAWSSGTGMAGVSGTLLYLLLRGVAHLSNQSIFLIATPTVIIYYIAFRIINRAAPYGGNATAPLIPSSAMTIDGNDEEASNGISALPPPVYEKGRTCRVLGMVWWRSTQLALVYFFEYVASVGFAAKANPKKEGSDWWYTNAFEILAFCYQIGVLISRSSISIIKIKRIWIMTFLQGANFALWLFQVLTSLSHLIITRIAS
jgi:battenin